MFRWEAYMPNAAKLVELSIQETSGVDHPAHLHEGWVVMKDASTLTEALHDIDQHSMNTESREKSAVDLTTTQATPVEEEQITEATEIHVAEVEASENVTKAEELTDLRKELENRDSRIQALEDERAFEKAESTVAGWSHLSKSADKLATALRDVRRAAPEAAAVIEEALTTANGQMESAGIFKELGTDASPEEEDAFGKLSRLADEAVEKGIAGNFSKAMSDVAIANPDLYQAYLKEKN